MGSRISHTTFDCRDAYALSEFWKQVLGYHDVPGDPNEPGHPECMIVGSDAEPRLLFIEVPEGKQVKNRVHLDLQPTDRSRDEEIERVVALGARPLHDLRNEDGTGWLVLADPEGNEFCILRQSGGTGSGVNASTPLEDL
jgi:catechol 2,3-dioxygenase-like lactoylglutathione lyase family enzyme